MVEGVSAISFIRVLIFFMRVLPSWPNQFPKTLLPNIITLGIRSPYMNFGGEETQTFSLLCFSSVQFSHSVLSNFLQPHGLQHTRLPCPSSTPRGYSNLRPLSQWCHPTISSSVVPFSSRLQFFPASGSFPMSRFFTSGGQSIGVSASA